MELALEALRLASVDEVPVATGTAVVAPTRDDWIVSENGVEGDVGLVFIAKVGGPVVDLLLTGRVPWHFAAEGIGFALPQVGADAHQLFELCGLLGAAFVFQIFE